MNFEKNYYVTTPIYYPNGKPHIGSLYSTLLADVFSRISKIMGKNVTFLTGTDEHGQKVFEASQKENKDIKIFLDEIVKEFKICWKEWNIDYSIFMRTTDEHHKKAIQEWILKLQEKKLIYKASYEGWYSRESEAFLTEKEITEKDEKGAPFCPISKKPAIWIKQDAYFFKLSAFQEKLLEFYEKNKNWVIPSERFEEVISFVKSGLKDLCISRQKSDLSWGINFPNDHEHVVYVWADALNNYLTGVGFLQNGREIEFEKNWPADLQIIGKDIFRFHAVFWPAFLMALDIPLPKKMLVHGWILVDNQKMSKSLGNVITPSYLSEKYGVDKSRYFFVRHTAITQDSSFSYKDFEEKTNAELCDNFGNLVQRVLSLIKRTNNLKINFKFDYTENDLYKKSLKMINDFIKFYEDGFLHRAYGFLWGYIDSVNGYVHSNEPWKLLSENKLDEFNKVILICLNAIKQISVLIWPIMPESSEKILKLIGLEMNSEKLIKVSELETWDFEFFIDASILNKIEPIFKKILIEEGQNKEMEDVILKPKNELINFDYFSKVVLRVGEIKEINEVKNSDKLYEFKVDFGEEIGLKTICAGIKKHYQKDELMNIKTVFVENLEPRRLCGTVSEGMTLMAENESRVPTIVKIEKSVKNGTRLK